MELITTQDKDIILFSANFIVDQLTRIARKANKPLLLALSGGGSPKALYPVLADIITKNLAQRLIIIQVDERIVEPTHKDSNQLLINDAMQKLFDKGAKFYAMPTHSTEASTCVEYEEILSPLFNADAVPAVALLGVGEDGHTASIFPDQIQDIPTDDRLVFMTPRKKNGYYRMSLSFSAIQAMQTLVLYAPGSKKKAIIEEVVNDNNIDKYPAAKVIHTHNNAHTIASLV